MFDIVLYSFYRGNGLFKNYIKTIVLAVYYDEKKGQDLLPRPFFHSMFV